MSKVETVDRVQAGETGREVAGPGSDLWAVLARLDRLLAAAVEKAAGLYGPGAAADPFRGMHLGLQDVVRLLDRTPGAPLFAPPPEQSPEPEHGAFGMRLSWLAQTYGLSPFDLDAIVIALAPEIDRRYERLYAYLQDDVSRRRPTVDLALNLLSQTADDRLARRAHFAPGAPLLLHQLLYLVPDATQAEPSLVARYLKVDEQIVRFLLGQRGPDERLAGFCRMIEPSVTMDDLLLEADLRRSLPILVRDAHESERPLRLYFRGPDAWTRRLASEALAGAAGMPLLLLDLAGGSSARPDLPGVLRLAFREAWLDDALLYLDGLDALDGDRGGREALAELLAGAPGITVTAGNGPWLPACSAAAGVLTIDFPIPGFDLREVAWRAALAPLGFSLAPDDLAALAGRFRLTPVQIADAVASAAEAAWRRAALEAAGAPGGEGPLRPVLTLSDLFTSARGEAGQELAGLARKVEPVYTWESIVLPEDSLAQLREICARVAQRDRVLGEWGFGRKLSGGKGVNVLFAGPSGTGKTMAAEIIANELGLDLYKIDLSGVVSKYIGETEKNLDRIFRAAENANAILFFDEADALFGKRSEVHDSHDRYANIEISYLLQKMEEFEGLAILATNLRQNLDDAFVRRLAFTVHFPFPGEAERLRIWQGIWPEREVLAGDVDLIFLARRFKLSGGNIKNITLSAAFLAAADGGIVSMDHLLHATEREFQKLGKSLSEEELRGAREHGLSANG